MTISDRSQEITVSESADTLYRLLSAAVKFTMRNRQRLKIAVSRTKPVSDTPPPPPLPPPDKQNPWTPADIATVQQYLPTQQLDNAKNIVSTKNRDSILLACQSHGISKACDNIVLSGSVLLRYGGNILEQWLYGLYLCTRIWKG